jgi:hypothetical protein
LGIHIILLTTFQLLLTGGVGGVLIFTYATKDIFLKSEVRSERPQFASDYQELMWLAGRQKQRLNKTETRRFYQLRHNWSGMHAPIV